MPKNDENQPLLDKDDAKAIEYTTEGENVASGKCFCLDSPPPPLPLFWHLLAFVLH